MAKPLLSIGIIFKNDIRCIEHCLKALQPLRDAVPCELVMADTGSTDGSREVAEKYADILIDFPWINDFSAARNAVMDRCTGSWFFTVDTDEYLHEDVSQLVEFLAYSDNRKEDACTVIVRNYDDYALQGDYTDFMAARIVRMSTGVRYHGAIHERWTFQGDNIQAYPLSNIILDHDGYIEVNRDSEKGKEKRKRNMTLLRELVQQEPDSLVVRLEWLESGGYEPDYLDQLRQSVKMIQEKKPGWQNAGPPIIRYAIYSAEQKQLPELDEWYQLAEEWFPNSMFIRLDVEFAAFVRSWNKQDYADCIIRGQRYLQAIKDFRNGADPGARMFSVLKMASEASEQDVKIYLAGAYQKEKKAKQGLELLQTLNFSILRVKQVEELLKVLQDIHFTSELNTEPIILAFWDGICEPKPSQKLADERKRVFVQGTGATFLPQNRKAEHNKEGFTRNAYTLYLPLRGKCEVGIAAAILETESIPELEAALYEVENWNFFSIYALAHALKCGVHFPLSSKPLTSEAMDNLTNRLAQDKNNIYSLATRLAQESNSTWQELLWVRSLLASAVCAYEWSSETQDTEQGMALTRAFAQVEEKFLPRCYSQEVLQKETLFVLPPLHRFGWYCAKAFAAMESQDTVGYVRLLREGLESCPDVKDMVEFLADHTADFQKLLGATPELLALAEQMRALLQQFDPNDPAILVLKSSPQYQQVAYLIERDTIQSPLLRQIPQ